MSAAVIRALLDELDEDGLLDLAHRLQPVLERITERPPQVLDTAGAAAFLDMHVVTVRRMAASGELPSRSDGPGCRRVYDRSALGEWRDTHTGGRVR